MCKKSHYKNKINFDKNFLLVFKTTYTEKVIYVKTFHDLVKITFYGNS